MVPLIDRQVFFGNPLISGGRISPDGRFISFIKPLDGVRNIWVKPFDAPFEDAIPITDDRERPVTGYFWSRDSKYVLYVQDKGGDENFHVYAVDPSATPQRGNRVPDQRDLTPYDGIRAYIMRLPKSDHNKLIVGLNDRDPAWHDLYEVEISTGTRKLLLQNDVRFANAFFDLKDRLRLLSRSLPDGGTEILRVDGDNLKNIFQVTHEESVSPLMFIDDYSVYLATNKGNSDLISLYTFHVESLQLKFMESDPLNEVDFGGAVFSDRTDQLLATSYVGDKTRIYWKDDSFGRDYEFLVDCLGTEEVRFVSGTEDELRWIVYANSDTDPGSAYLFVRGQRELKFLYKPRPELPSEHLCPMNPVRFRSSDGLEIPAYLTLPKGVKPKGLPAIILVHGGPWARDFWGYHSYAQFLTNRGYAVLQPNFRGSTGFGKAFLNAGNGEWGEKMQDDVTYGVYYLIEQGIADKDRIGIMGGSYGGYATLAGLTFTPDLYRCGVSIVGPSNLFTLLESIPPYWETVREMFHIRMGNPTTEEGRTLLKRKSPYFHAGKIKSPLLVAQGNNDPRVKTAESDQIARAMNKHNLDVEYINFPDEGHGFANPLNQMAFLSVAEKFLAKHLGGRHQSDVPDNLQKIVDRARVNVAEL